MKEYAKEILLLLGNDRYKIIWFILLFLGVSLLELAGLGLISPYVALVVDPQSLNGSVGEYLKAVGLPTSHKAMLVVLGIILLVIFVAKSIGVILINALILRFCQQRQLNLRAYLTASYQGLNYVDYLTRNASEYIYSVQELTRRYAEMVLFPVMRMLSDSIVALVILVLLAWHNIGALILLASLVGGMVFGYDLLFRHTLKAAGQKSNNASTLLVQHLQEAVSGLKVIRVFGKEKYFYDAIYRCASEYARNQTKSQIISTAPRYLLELLMISFVVLLVIGAILIDYNLKSLIPTLALFGAAALRIIPMANVFSKGLVQLRYNRDAVYRLYKDLESLKSMDLEYHGIVNSDERFRELVLDRVFFRYPAASVNALNDISMELLKGESIGLIGPSGSGKSTLVDLLLGLLYPSSGSLSYNGLPLSEVIDSWRSKVAYLPQEVFLIDGTLRDNIALGEPVSTIDESRLDESIAQARLSNLVEELPKGLETSIGERGVRLSGGQRQRVALARAFYHQREVLVMDEATSALDNNTEQEIVDEIRNLKGKITMVVIAHRLTTVRHCDRIYKLENGTIVEKGPPEKLAV